MAKTLWDVFSLNAVHPKYSKSVNGQYTVYSVDQGTSKGTGVRGRGRVAALIAHLPTKLFLFSEKCQNSSIRKPQPSCSSTNSKSKHSLHTILRGYELHINYFMGIRFYVSVLERAVIPWLPSQQYAVFFSATVVPHIEFGIWVSSRTVEHFSPLWGFDFSNEGHWAVAERIGNNKSRPLSHCFNMANYFRGICHQRTIKRIRIRSWHPVWRATRAKV